MKETDDHAMDSPTLDQVQCPYIGLDIGRLTPGCEPHTLRDDGPQQEGHP